MPRVTDAWTTCAIARVADDAVALRQVYDANRGVDLTSSRLYVPKPGPKPPGDIPPCNFVEPAYIDEGHRIAAVRVLD
eukprot:3329341-Amphidinium_carterae.1